MGSTIAPSITQQFLAAEGNQQVTFNFFQGNSQSIIQLLKEEKIDIALSSRIDQEEDIHYLPFVQQEMVLVVPQSHPLAIHDSISLKETTEFPYVYFSKNSGLRTYIDSLTANSGLTPKIACEVEEDHTMLGFVGCNFGIAIMPDIPSISAYPVKKIAISDSRPPRYIYLATRKNGFMSPAVKRFYEFCLHHIKS
jgi:DNA-binding transcriptional LysR family regulator